MTPAAVAAETGAPGAPVVLDVRTRWEFSRGRVAGAKHIPFWALPFRMSELGADRHAPIVVYCELGPRAHMARAVMRICGFRRVMTLAGHWAAWKRSGLPRERG